MVEYDGARVPAVLNLPPSCLSTSSPPPGQPSSSSNSSSIKHPPLEVFKHFRHNISINMFGFASTSSTNMAASVLPVPATARVHDSPRNSHFAHAAALDDFFGARPQATASSASLASAPSTPAAPSVRTRDDTPAATITPLPLDRDIDIEANYTAPPEYASAFELPSYESVVAEPDTLAKHLFKFGFRKSSSIILSVFINLYHLLQYSLSSGSSAPLSSSTTSPSPPSGVRPSPLSNGPRSCVRSGSPSASGHAAASSHGSSSASPSLPPCLVFLPSSSGHRPPPLHPHVITITSLFLCSTTTIKTILHKMPSIINAPSSLCFIEPSAPVRTPYMPTLLYYLDVPLCISISQI
jgi:hypothetical protein